MASTAVYNGREIEAEEAVKIRDELGSKNVTFTCTECEQPVRVHKAGGHNPAHFQHLKHDNTCSKSDQSY